MQMQKSLHNNVQFSYKNYSFYGYNSIMITPSFQLRLKTMILRTNQTVFGGQINYGKTKMTKTVMYNQLLVRPQFLPFLFLMNQKII